MAIGVVRNEAGLSLERSSKTSSENALLKTRIQFSEAVFYNDGTKGPLKPEHREAEEKPCKWSSFDIELQILGGHAVTLYLLFIKNNPVMDEELGAIRKIKEPDLQKQALKDFVRTYESEKSKGKARERKENEEADAQEELESKDSLSTMAALVKRLVHSKKKSSQEIKEKIEYLKRQGVTTESLKDQLTQLELSLIKAATTDEKYRPLTEQLTAFLEETSKKNLLEIYVENYKFFKECADYTEQWMETLDSPNL